MSRGLEELKDGYMVYVANVTQCKYRVENVCTYAGSDYWGQRVHTQGICDKCNKFAKEDEEGLGYVSI